MDEKILPWSREAAKKWHTLPVPDIPSVMGHTQMTLALNLPSASRETEGNLTAPCASGSLPNESLVRLSQWSLLRFPSFIQLDS